MNTTTVEGCDAVAGQVERPVGPSAEANLRDAVLTLNHLWNTSADEAAIADQLDLCRRLAKYTPEPQTHYKFARGEVTGRQWLEAAFTWAGLPPDKLEKVLHYFAFRQLDVLAVASNADAEDVAWLVVQEACETDPADEDDPECIRILRRDLKTAALAAIARAPVRALLPEDVRADAETGARWRANSSLEEWFPITAEELAQLRSDVAMWKREARACGSVKAMQDGVDVR